MKDYLPFNHFYDFTFSPQWEITDLVLSIDRIS